VLDDNVSVQLPLDSGTCTPSLLPSKSASTARLARLIWSIVSGPTKGLPPELMWQVSMEPEEGRNVYLSDDMRYYWKPR